MAHVTFVMKVYVASRIEQKNTAQHKDSIMEWYRNNNSTRKNFQIDHLAEDRFKVSYHSEEWEIPNPKYVADPDRIYYENDDIFDTTEIDHRTININGEECILIGEIVEDPEN